MSSLFKIFFLMDNPYIVHLALNAKIGSSKTTFTSNKKHVGIKEHIMEIGELDKHNNKLYYMIANSSDTHYKICLDLAFAVWQNRFGITRRHMADENSRTMQTIVLFTLNTISDIQPLAAARIRFYETNNTRTAKIYSLASYYDGMHHGSILLRKISEVAAGAQCQFMTVDVSRPQITHPNEILRFLADKSEARFWNDEKPTPYKKYNDINSSKRTQRVERLLNFYHRNGFCFCVKVGDPSNAHKGNKFETLWGSLDPFYSYTLVAALETHNSNFSLDNARLIRWSTAWDLRNNYDKYEK
jgi:hypothetical protein